MEAPTPPQIISFTGENSSFFRFLPDDLLPGIFKYLKISEALSTARVCWRWRVSINDRVNLGNAHPKLSYLRSELRMQPSQFIGLVNRYEDKLKTLNLQMCRTLTDSDLASLTAKFSSLKICMTPLVTEAGVITLVDKMVSPLKLEIGFGTNITLSRLFAAFAERGIQLKKLNLSQCSQRIGQVTHLSNNIHLEKPITAQDLCQLIAQGGLTSPCSLDLSAEDWVDRSILEALVTKGVKLNYINLTETPLTSDDLLYLATNKALAPACEIILDDSLQPTDDLVDAMIAQGIKLRSLNLRCHLPLSPEHLRKLILQCVDSPCAMEISYAMMSTAVIDLILESQVTIDKLDVIFCHEFAPPGLTQEFVKLLTRARFATPFTLNINEDARISHPEASTIFSCLNNPLLRISHLELDNVKSFPQAVLQEMCAKEIFTKTDFVLHLSNCGWDTTAVLESLRASQISFKDFEIGEKTQAAVNITSLALSGCFKNSKRISLPKSTQDIITVLNTLASSSVNQLSCHLDEEAELALIEMLGSRENYRNLNILRIFSGERLVEKINKIRPNITVIVSTPDSDSVSEINADPEND